MYGYDFEVTGYTLETPVPIADLRTASAMVDLCSVAAPEMRIKALLAELRVATKARAERDDDLVLGFQLYAEEMAKYPADIAAAAVKRIARRDKFYPSLSELVEELLRESRPRRLLRETLSKSAKRATEE